MSRVTRRRPLYTIEEDQIILESVAEYPDNLQHAFDEAAISLEGRNAKSISQRYYNTLRKGEQTHISVSSKKGSTSNVKNKRRVENVFEQRNLSPVKSIILQMLDLDDASIEKIKSFLDL